jgi:hypothetical protein
METFRRGHQADLVDVAAVRLRFRTDTYGLAVVVELPQTGVVYQPRALVGGIPPPELRQRVIDRTGKLDSLSVAWPAGASRSILEVVAGLEDWLAGSGQGPMPMAVLVSDDGYVPLDCEHAAYCLLTTIGVSPERFVVVHETATHGTHGSFRLPFEIVRAGAGSPRLAANVNSIVFDPAVAAHAFRHTRLGRGDSILGTSCDVLVTSVTRLMDDLQHRSQVGGSTSPGPRLIVAFERRARASFPDARHLDVASSIVVVRAAAPNYAPDVFTRHLLRALAHDLPIHAAAREAVDSAGLMSTRGDVRLYSRYEALNVLRLSDAWSSVLERSRDMEPYARSGPAEMPDVPGLDASIWEPVTVAVEMAESLEPDFRFESGGLTDLAHTEAEFCLAEEAISRLTAAARDIERDPSLVSALEGADDRRVAIRIRHREVRGTLRDLTAEDDFLAGATYVLESGVGIQWPTDFVSMDAPAISRLLPLSTTATVDLVLFAEGADVVGDAVRSLDVPRIGPSSVCSFELRIHEAAPRVRLRLNYYYRGHLLQCHEVAGPVASDNVTATTSVGGTAAASGSIRWQLVFTRSESLRCLDEVPETSLALVVNADVNSATHSIQAYGGGATGHATVEAEVLGPWQLQVRRVLGEMFDEVHEGVATSASFDGHVIRLAYFGRRLRVDGLYRGSSDALKSQLTAIKTSTGLNLQVLRRARRLAIQWWLLYDWDLPNTETERSNITVCRGLRNGDHCGHSDNPPGILCVRGFWGLRHRISEFINADETALVSRPRPRASAPADGVPVICAIHPRMPNPRPMIAKFERYFGAGRVKDWPESEALRPELDDPGRRPAVLVIVGHLENADRLPEPPTVELRSTERYLHSLYFPIDDYRWESPHRPIVFLLACRSGADIITQLPSLVRTLLDVGAGAVLSAETDIDAQLANDVLLAFAPHLMRGTLGDALITWRQKCMARGDPSALFFTTFGDADVTVGA